VDLGKGSEIGKLLQEASEKPSLPVQIFRIFGTASEKISCLNS